jgi:hypothetical protein
MIDRFEPVAGAGELVREISDADDGDTPDNPEGETPKSRYPVLPSPCTNPSPGVTVPWNVPLVRLFAQIAFGAAACQTGK